MAELVLVTGTARSGKSLVCSLFDGHPMVQVWPLELMLSKRFGDLLDRTAVSATRQSTPVSLADLLLSNVSGHISTFYEDVDLSDVDFPRLRGALCRRLAALDSTDLTSVLRCFGESVAEVLGSSPKILMFDVKAKTEHLCALLDSGAPVRLLFMNRDPRHVYLALRAKQFSNYGAGNWLTGDGQPLLQSLVDHIVQYGGGPYAAALAADPRVYVLRYEDLVREAETVLCRVAAWLSIASRWDLMTVPTRFSRPVTLDRHAGLKGCVRDPSRPGTAGRLSLVEQAVLRRCFTVGSVASVVTPAAGPLRRALLVLACLLPLAGELMRFVRGHWVGVVRAGVRNRAYAARVFVLEVLR